MRFVALEVSVEVIRSLRQPLEVLRSRDPELFRQVRKAASSIPLNLAEGNRRSGKDRVHHFRIAAGSADEVRTALRVAAAWGDLQEPAIAESLRLLDRLLGMLWRLGRSTPQPGPTTG
jgi:four helix bundle protein